MKPVAAMACSTVLRRCFARSGLLNGEYGGGGWVPAAEVALAAEDIRQHRAGRADPVDAGVFIEAAILDCDHRLDHVRRNRGKRHVAPLFPPLGRQRRQERRVELDRLEWRPAADELD